VHQDKATAVVVGGSVAGLATALALAPHMERVLVLERHELPADGSPSTIVPQGRFPHVLLAGGAAALERIAPGFGQALFRAGAVGAPGPRPCHWWAAGHVRRTLPDLGLAVPMCSRELVETTLRNEVLSRPTITLLSDTAVRGLRVEGGRVVGVDASSGKGRTSALDADLVVDATGRGARSVAWLEAASLPTPRLERVNIGVTYTSVEVQRDATDLDGGAFAVVQNTRDLARIGVALPTELGRWRIVLGGYFGDAAPVDRDGLLAFAASLPDPALHVLLSKAWLTSPCRYAFPSSQRRGWASTPLPTGFAAVGDSVASFNPVYGQGMSSAVLQAEAVAACLDRHGITPAFTKAAARAAAKVADSPWRIATGADFIYSRTQGDKPRGTDLVNGYVERVMRVAPYEPHVGLALARVQSMMSPPQSLMSPGVMARVLRQARGTTRAVVAREPVGQPS
jgi:2-polyprenyl-6-methoxyphenol hydroxylase-like FAD-dependent oxidoreductase